MSLSRNRSGSELKGQQSSDFSQTLLQSGFTGWKPDKKTTPVFSHAKLFGGSVEFSPPVNKGVDRKQPTYRKFNFRKI